MRKDVYQITTDRIVNLLEEGTVPWHKPWGGQEEHPRNLVSGKKYRGINAFVLSALDYGSPYWLTYKQAKDREGHVRKGERGFPCVYWNWTEKEDSKTGEIEKCPFLKYYTVFNVEQCDDVPYPSKETGSKKYTPIETCEKVISEMPTPPQIRQGGQKAFYCPGNDLVQVPLREKFENPEFYYSALFHELIHSTGHESRLARPGIIKETALGSDPYGKEELIAEMGATFLCGYSGIENKVIDNSAAYIDGWLGQINDNSRLVVTAGAQAQKAADHILGENLEYCV